MGEPLGKQREDLAGERGREAVGPVGIGDRRAGCGVRARRPRAAEDNAVAGGGRCWRRASAERDCAGWRRVLYIAFFLFELSLIPHFGVSKFHRSVHRPQSGRPRYLLQALLVLLARPGFRTSGTLLQAPLAASSAASTRISAPSQSLDLRAPSIPLSPVSPYGPG